MSENREAPVEKTGVSQPMGKEELLIYFHKHVVKEKDFLRKRQDSIFAWSSGVLTILTGALLVVEPTKNPLWYSYGIWGKVVASLAVLCFVGFSVFWQQRNRMWHKENADVAAKIARILHCFEQGYYDPEGSRLFPKQWEEMEDKDPQTFLKRVWRVNYVSATIVLGLLAVGMIWVR